MPRIDVLLDQLDHFRHQFGNRDAEQVKTLLDNLARKNFDDADSLLKFHETLLFLRAYPHSPQTVHRIESILRSFPKRLKRLEDQGQELSQLNHPEVSGIAGLSVTDTFSFHIVRWLLQRYPDEVKLQWDWFEDENRLAQTWPRFMPFLKEDASVEANVPYREWLRLAHGTRTALPWLLDRFSSLQLSDEERSEIYDSQKLYVSWRPRYQSTRTGLRGPAGTPFYQTGPLIQRREVQFLDELSRASPRLRKLSFKEGERALDLAREASTVRYRELYGFTHGDPRHVYRANLGRGCELFIIGLPPEKRLPLRAYHAAMIYRNSVPVGYFEGLSICDRMESGFNLYYTFRDGETAWLYARTLNVMGHLTGVTAFSLDPYQIGHENEEGVESGAFWFYRKLGFRPTEKQVLQLTKIEEEKLSSGKGYRTRPATLRKLATSSMILELDQARSSDWDRFQVRKIGFAIQRLMAKKFNGEAERLRSSAIKLVAQVLEFNAATLSQLQAEVFGDFAVVLSLIPDLMDWSADEKRQLLGIIRAKATGEETRYLKLTQEHERFRQTIIRLGSKSA